MNPYSTRMAARSIFEACRASDAVNKGGSDVPPFSVIARHSASQFAVSSSGMLASTVLPSSMT